MKNHLNDNINKGKNIVQQAQQNAKNKSQNMKD